MKKSAKKMLFDGKSVKKMSFSPKKQQVTDFLKDGNASKNPRQNISTRKFDSNPPGHRLLLLFQQPENVFESPAHIVVACRAQQLLRLRPIGDVL